MSERALDAAQLDRLALLADVLIPTTPEVGGALELRVLGAQLDAVLSARPELVMLLQEVVAFTGSAETYLRDLHAKNKALFEPLAFALLAAWTQHPDVRAFLGYRGQEPQSIAPTDAYDVLDAVANATFIQELTV